MKSFQNTFVEDCLRIRAASPLIHNITNYVAMQFSANALLAVGASPIMSSEPREMEELVSSCNALVINIGCLEASQIEAMHIAAAKAAALGKPWVLDPAGAGASRLRTETALALIKQYKPTVIRGNASEMLALSGAEAESRGVDATHPSSAAMEAARELALTYSCVVSTSGETDYITDGKSILCINNGDPLMTRVTAMGCVASAITAAFCAVQPDALAASAEAMALMGVAGEKAKASSNGTGSLQTAFLDILSTAEPEALAAVIKWGEI